MDSPLSASPNELPLAGLVRERIAALLRRLEGRSVPGLYRVVIDEVERGVFGAALEQAHGEVGLAARLLGVDRNTVARRAKALGLVPRGRGRKKQGSGVGGQGSGNITRAVRDSGHLPPR